jgi:hypothetical protein
MMNEIRFKNLEFVNNKLSADIVIPRKYRKYLLSSSINIEYDSDIEADESILNIPLVSTMLPLAWLTGLNIHVDRLDKSFKNSIDQLQNHFKEMYPKISFKSGVHVDELVENQIELDDPKQETGLLFSGGVDSTYSLISNLEHKPRLIMIWGVDGYPYPENSEYWKNVISTYSDYSNTEKLIIHIIKTDALRVLHARRIEHDFHTELLEGSLWVRFQFALFILPLVAPLSMDKFNQLLIAAGHDPTYQFSYGPEAIEPIAEQIYWANLKSKLDGFIPRNDKIKKLKNEISEKKVKFRVCQKHQTLKSGLLNCSSCEKCYRTILPLVITGIDPNDCGFDVNESTFRKIKSFFLEKKIPILHIEDQWKPIQKMIPYDIESDSMSSKDFFNWFRDFDLGTSEKDVWFYLDLYNKLPWPVSKVLDELYKINEISIHDHSPLRTRRKDK